MAESAELLAVEARLKDFISGNLNKIKTNMKGFEKQTKKSFGGAAQSGKKLGLVAQQLKTAFIGLLTIAAVKFAVIDTTKAFMKFESRMAEVNTIARLNKEELAGVTKQLEDMSLRIPKSADELGAGLYQVLSAGIKDTSDAMFVLEEATKLAIAGVADTGSTVKLVTGIINAYGFEIEDAAKVSDILFKTVENGVVTIPELANSIGRVVPIARAAGISLEELTGGIATLTAAGVPSEIAVTALRGAIGALSAPTPAAAKALKELGIVMKDDLVETIKQFEGLDPKALKALIPDIRAATAVITLANNYKKFGENVSSALDAGGSSLKAFSEQMDTTSADLTLMANEWEKTKRSIGGAIGALIRWGKKFDDFMANAPLIVKALSGDWVAVAKHTSKAKDETDSLVQSIEAARKRSVALNKANTDRIKQQQKAAKDTGPKASDEEQKQILDAETRLKESRLLLLTDENVQRTKMLKLQHETELLSVGDNEKAKNLLISAHKNELAALERDINTERAENEVDLANITKERLKKINDERIEQLKVNAQQQIAIVMALGAAITSGIGQGSDAWKTGLKNILLVTLSFLEQMFVAQKVAALAKAGINIFQAPAELAKVLLTSAAIGAARAGIQSFQTAPGEVKTVPGDPNQGRLAIVHGQEQIGRPINNTNNALGGNTINVYTLSPDIMERQIVEAMERALRNKRLDKFKMKYENA